MLHFCSEVIEGVWKGHDADARSTWGGSHGVARPGRQDVAAKTQPPTQEKAGGCDKSPLQSRCWANGDAINPANKRSGRD